MDEMNIKLTLVYVLMFSKKAIFDTTQFSCFQLRVCDGA